MSDGRIGIAEPEQVLVEDFSSIERPRDTNLESIVQLPTWREVLVDMVYQNEIDPWNVDVAQVANKYLEAVRGMQMDDLRVPANLILAASILVRFKSDMVSLEEKPVQSELDEFMDDYDPQEIAPLELSSRIAPKGRITLDELVQAVGQVMDEAQEKDQKRAQRAAEVYIEPVKNLQIRVSEFKIEDEVGHLYQRMKSMADSQNLVAFSSLVEKKDKRGIVFTFLPLLFLANEGKVSLAQDSFFGEIFIRIANKSESGLK